MTELYIISGFLGSGKTTLIGMLSKQCFQGCRLVVLENDFGVADVDSEILQQNHIKVSNLSGGCICCSMNVDFAKKLIQIKKKYDPEIILIEPSGISKVSSVIKSCLKAEASGDFRLAKVITIVDVCTFLQYHKNYGAFFEDQVSYADVVLLSHQEEAGGVISEVSDRLRKINLNGKIITDLWNHISPYEILNAQRNSLIAELMIQLEREQKPMRIRAGNKGSGKIGLIDHLFGRKKILAVSLSWEEPIDKDTLERKVKAVLSLYKDDILRAKGIVTAPDGRSGILFQYIAEGLWLEPTGNKGSELCFIGIDLDEKVIEKAFKEG